MLGRLSIARRLQLCLGLGIVGMVISSAGFYLTLQSVAVLGPNYLKIVQGKDVIADILPPPEYIVETHLLVFEMVNAAKEGAAEIVQAKVTRLNSLHREFTDRQTHWDKNLIQPKQRILMLETLAAPAKDYYRQLFAEVVPACLGGRAEEAHAALCGPLTRNYEQHRVAVNELVALTNSQNQAIEEGVRNELDRSVLGCLLISGVTVTMMFSIGLYVIWGTITPLQHKAQCLSASAHQFGRIAEGVSAAVGHLDESIREISLNASQAEQVCATATSAVEKTTIVLHGLSSSSTEIGEVIGLIKNITHQTNLLALNATIEAARAGAAGVGFAVVAREVKELASQTAEAANSIVRHIEAIRTETHSALNSIELVTEVVAAIQQGQSMIAAAVNEQSVLTLQVARSVEEMTDSSHTMTDTAEQLMRDSSGRSVGGAVSRAAASVERGPLFAMS